MRELLATEPFESVRVILQQAAEEIRRISSPIMLLAAPSLQGALSLAPIEAALVDAGIPYRRRFRMETPAEGAWIHILGPGTNSGPSLSTDPLRLSISEIVVTGLMGHQGDERKGPLTAIAQCHALAQAISPQGVRTRRMRPWALSGNWLHSALDTTYDPVYTSLRDEMAENGLIRIVPLPEVTEPNVSQLNWIDSTALDAITSRWATLEMEGKARALSHLVKPSLTRSTPSTARLEEIIWHCILSPGWSTDLAGQISQAASMWKESSSAAEASRDLVDSLIRNGTV